MIKEYQSQLLIIASRTLSYPNNEDKKLVSTLVKEMEVLEEVKNSVKDAVDNVYRIPMKSLRETYVDTFDLKEQVGLYLSAHEFGDSPRRGAALIKLQKIVNEAGYERIDGELADFIPMLYEFVAVAEESSQKDRLIKRLGCVTQKILNHLPEENPYHSLLSLMMQFVFEVPTKEDLEKMDQDREEADLEELPYPIMYK